MISFFENFLATQRHNGLLWVPVLIGAGAGFYFGLKAEPSVMIAPGMMGVCLVAGVGLWFMTRRVQLALILIAAFFLIALGWGVAQWRTDDVAAPVLTKEIKVTMVEGTIQSLDSLEDGKGTRVILRDVSIEKLDPAQTPYAVRISVRKDEGLMPGQRIRVLAGLNPPSPPVTPGGYDFQRYAWFMRVGAFGFAYKAPVIVEQVPEDKPGLAQSFLNGLESFRQSKANRVREVVPEPEASIVSALLLGERAGIPESTWQDIRAAGLAHVISISGLHIALIAGGILFVVRFLMALVPRFALYHPIKKYAAIIALIGCTMYAVMVGLSVPTLRSVIMTGLILVAIMFDRSPFSLRLVALSALVILFTTPEGITGPSFQMSFAAVAALIFFYDETRNWWTRQNRNAGWMGKGMLWLLGMAATSIIATCATAPLTLYHFQQFPFYSVVGNLLALPVISFMVMPAAVIAYILMPFGLDFAPLWVMGKGISAMLWISEMVAAWPYASINLPAWPLSSLLCFTVAGLVLMVLIGRVRWLCVVPLVAGIILVATHRPPDIQISSSGKLAMLRMGDDLYLSNKKTERFTAEAWVREAGTDPEAVKVWPKEGRLDHAPDSLSCDHYGCLAQVKSHEVAFSFDQRTIAEDCTGPAQIIISSKPIPDRSCADKAVIDMWDLRHGGTHAIRLYDDHAEIKTVTGERGVRPWTSGAGR